MPFTRVGSLGTLPEGEILEAEVAGKPYAVCNVDGELHAVVGVCPHRGGPLGQGALHGSTLVCPWHGWEFDCRTGENVVGGAGATKVGLKVDGDDILIDVP